MRCTECGAENLEGSRFCSRCAKPLPQMIHCPSCGGEILQGSIFCPLCAARIEGDKAFGRGGGSTYGKNAGKPAPLSSPFEDEAAEDPGSDGSATLFCAICNEPTASTQLMFDHEGNRVCKKCMDSGGKKKSRRTRMIEAMKLEVEGTNLYKTTQRGVTKVVPKSSKAPKAPELEEKKKSRGLLVVFVLFLLLAAGGGAAWFFLLHKNPGNLAAVKRLLGLAGPSKDAPADEEEKEPAPEASLEPRWFTGTFVGENTEEEGELRGALVFQAEGEEPVYIVPPEGQDLASAYFKGLKYTFKFKPDAGFAKSRRLTLAMLEEPIQEVE